MIELTFACAYEDLLHVGLCTLMIRFVCSLAFEIVHFEVLPDHHTFHMGTAQARAAAAGREGDEEGVLEEQEVSRREGG